ncbi:MAG TPA: ribonuclease HII [Patescibacteria group bacterium]|nr:ribonuclease HII [Patescibacteria group bacterium]
MKLPNLSFEKSLHKKGFRIIAGVDEVGRGAFAGPVVAAAVAFAPNSNYQLPISNKFSKKIIINDSKKLSAKQRGVSDLWIRENAQAYGIGEASVTQINKLGIKKATEIAFRKAISCLQSTDNRRQPNKKTVVGGPLAVDYLLVDAFYIPYVKGLRRRNQKAIVKGDTKSVSIAAASIIAKVYRDKLMVKLSKQTKFRKYGWGKNKGYGTKEHREAIKKYGTTTKHRTQFVESMLKKS